MHFHFPGYQQPQVHVHTPSNSSAKPTEAQNLFHYQKNVLVTWSEKFHLFLARGIVIHLSSNFFLYLSYSADTKSICVQIYPASFLVSENTSKLYKEIWLNLFSVCTFRLWFIFLQLGYFSPPWGDIEFKVIMLTHSPFVCSGEKSRHFLLYQHPHLDILQGSCQICAL